MWGTLQDHTDARVWITLIVIVITSHSVVTSTCHVILTMTGDSLTSQARFGREKQYLDCQLCNFCYHGQRSQIQGSSD
jgi:hypothetical protein